MVGAKKLRRHVVNCGRAADVPRRALERSGVNAVCVNTIEVFRIKEIFVVGG
jgi:hypothetical protein